MSSATNPTNEKSVANKKLKEENMRCCSPKCQNWTFYPLAVVLLLLGILTVTLWGRLVNTIIEKELSVSNQNSQEYKMWIETPIPMYIEFYLFNWTNAQEVIDSKFAIKPNFAECGPYTYSEHHIRKEVVFNDNETISYKTQRIWHFLPEKSIGSLDDEITTINTILAAVASMLKYEHIILRLAVNFLVEEKRVNLTVTKTAGQFLFDGYEDPLLDLVHKLNMSKFDVPFDKFGWFYTRNESIEYDGAYNMYDGSDDIRKMGRFASWNYENTTQYYSGECGQVQGTSGELWYPIHDDSTVQVFSSDVCSAITLYRSGDSERLGVKGHRFVATEQIFDNGTKYPEMACYSPGDILPSGVRNVSQCKWGAPAFVSHPHFLMADEFYRSSITGMEPNETLHGFSLSLEPETGIPLDVIAALQINIHLESLERIKLLEHVKDLYIPTMWFKQYAELTEDLAKKAKLILNLPTIGMYVGYSVIGVGGVLLALAMFLTIKRRETGTDEEQLLDRETN